MAVILGFALGLLSLGTQLRPPREGWPKRIADIVGGLAYLSFLGLLLWGFWPNKGVRISLYVVVGLAALLAAWWVGARETARSGSASTTLRSTMSSSQTPGERGAWQPPVSPDRLAQYLDAVNRTMEEKGFGRNPNLPHKESTQGQTPTQEELEQILGGAKVTIGGMKGRAKERNPAEKPDPRDTPYRSRFAVSFRHSADGHSYMIGDPVTQEEAVRQGIVAPGFDIWCRVERDLTAALGIATTRLEGLAGLAVKVEAPDEEISTWRAPEAYEVPNPFETGYPRPTFPRAHDPLETGNYRVEFLIGEDRIAEGWFTLPEGRPGWFVEGQPERDVTTDQEGMRIEIRRPHLLDDALHAPRCTVTDLDGKEWTKEVQRTVRQPGSVPDPVPNAAVLFPGDFIDQDGHRPELRGGVYLGEWSAWFWGYPGGSGKKRLTVRKFRFSWPEGWIETV